MSPRVGAVAIGRNEGERLVRCLDALVAAEMPVVYVDSNSTDNSLTVATERGVTSVELDLSIKFTAARARNAGAAKLFELHPELEYVQFVDGDCELVDGWVATALEALDGDSTLVAVCGRRRERFPDSSVYNRVTDMEWDTPIGEADACGGDATYRRSTFEAVDGFDETLIAGEEPELCHRLRLRGGRILRIDAETTLHDADMHRFGQWWKRTRRSGHAATEAWFKHGSRGQLGMVRIAQSALLYGVVLPGVCALAVLVKLLSGAGMWVLLPPLLLAAVYARLVIKVRRHRIDHGDTLEDAGAYARLMLVGKFAESAGSIEYLWNRLRGRGSQLIEYK